MIRNTKLITSCEVCGNNELISVLDLGSHPMCDDLVEISSDRICAEYPIEILFCKNCITAHQKYQLPKKELFPINYHYRARFTKDVLNGMKQLVVSCEQMKGSLVNKKVLDIGCNDGSLLNFFKEKGAKTYGVEPTYAYKDAQDHGHIIYKGFFTEDVSREFVKKNGHPDLITFTNVFAHIENLQEVLNALKILMVDETLLVIENHYLGAVVNGKQFDTFYHEHPRTYSFSSFQKIAQSMELDVLNVDFPSRYGGNIQVILGVSSEASPQKNTNYFSIVEHEKYFFDMLSGFQQQIKIWREKKTKIIIDLVKQFGRLNAKAFPGRAAILVKLLNLDEKSIKAVYEKPGSLKINHYIPGTKIPIFSDESLFAPENKTQPLLNLAWHISDEIYDYMRSRGFLGDIINILSLNDFVSEALAQEIY